MRHSQPVAARIAAGFTSRGLAIAGLALLGAIHPLGISSQGGQESSTIAPLPSFAEPAISPDRSENSSRIGRRHLDGRRNGRRCAPSRVARGERVTAALLSRR